MMFDDITVEVIASFTNAYIKKAAILLQPLVRRSATTLGKRICNHMSAGGATSGN